MPKLEYAVTCGRCNTLGWTDNPVIAMEWAKTHAISCGVKTTITVEVKREG